MRFDCVITGGGLAGLIAGISLQKEGRSTAIVSTGQNAMHFFSGIFESVKEVPARLAEIFEAAGIKVHYSAGVRLMPMGTFREAELALGDVDIFPSEKFASKALIVSFRGEQGFFTGFLADGLEKAGIACRLAAIDRSSDIKKIAAAVSGLLDGEDAVVLPQVFGQKDSADVEYLREAIPAKVVFAGTQPPSVPGIRTQMQLKDYYISLGGTFLQGDEVTGAHVHDGVVHSVVTRNLDSHYLEADCFVLASGGFFSKGLLATPTSVVEPVFGLDVDYPADRSEWYDPSFAADQPYMRFGVKTDVALHPMIAGESVRNLYVAGSILGATRPEFGTGAGLAIRSAFAVVDSILKP